MNKFKRYIGHNGKRRKIERLTAHLQHMADYNADYEAMRDVSNKVYELILSMPVDDIVYDKPMYRVNLLMSDAVWREDMRDAHNAVPYG